MMIGILPTMAIGAEMPEIITIDMKVGESKKLEVAAANYFMSTNTGIALVSQKGDLSAKSAGTAHIYAYLNGKVVGLWKIIVEAKTSDVESPAVKKGDFPFVPDEKNLTNGHIKSGWKYFIAYDNGKFRITSDGIVAPSMRYNNPFYVEHLGGSYYYIRTVDGKFLCYEGDKPYYNDKEQIGNALIVRDKPYKWYVYPQNDAGVIKYSFAANENRELFIGTYEPCGEDRDGELRITKAQIGKLIGERRSFEVLDADRQSIPEWWYRYKGEEVQTDQYGYDYYSKQDFKSETNLPVIAVSENYNLEIPSFQKNFLTYGKTVQRQLLSRNERGTYILAIVDDTYVTIEKLSVDGKSLGSKTIKLDDELSMFGAIYSGEKFNYIAFGQNNPNEDSNKESIRIVKYDKEFNRISSVSVSSGQTIAIKPLIHTARFSESGNQLVLHTTRQRFKSSDGMNHQSNLDIIVNTDTMKTTYVSSDYPKNHVSHSFNTFVRFDGNDFVFLDHGDGFPRSVVLHKGTQSSYKKASMFDIYGPEGANYTGVMVGGLEISNNNYLTAIASIDQASAKWGKASEDSTKNSSMVPINEKGLNQHNVILSVVPRNFGDGATAQNITIENYIGTSKICSPPQLLKFNNNKFAVLWAEYSLQEVNFAIDEDGETTDDEVPLRYVVQYVDGDGNKLSSAVSYQKVDDFYKEYLNTVATKSTLAEPEPEQTTPAKHPFTDVKAGSYYEDAVVWALENKVTSGVSDTKFAPNDTCTRGQVVTFLWRAKGSPEPKNKSNPFVDINVSDYYYKAVLWAVENGITSGTSANTFSPDDTSTSGQVATFLWRSNGSPNKTGKGEYYQDAINWANANGLLSGTDTAFNAINNSPRADIVTYLYRNAVNSK